MRGPLQPDGGLSSRGGATDVLKLPVRGSSGGLWSEAWDMLEGRMEYGADYAREIIVTTTDWSAYWAGTNELTSGYA